MPGPLGMHNWHPMSFNPETGLVYLPSFELGFPYVADANFKPRKLAVNLGIDLAASRLPDDAKVKAEVLKAVRGHLVAWDPVQQKKVWDVEHAAAWNGGVLSTAGNLVFQGEATGTSRHTTQRLDRGSGHSRHRRASSRHRFPTQSTASSTSRCSRAGAECFRC